MDKLRNEIKLKFKEVVNRIRMFNYSPTGIGGKDDGKVTEFFGIDLEDNLSFTSIDKITGEKNIINNCEMVFDSDSKIFNKFVLELEETYESILEYEAQKENENRNIKHGGISTDRLMNLYGVKPGDIITFGSREYIVIYDDKFDEVYMYMIDNETFDIDTNIKFQLTSLTTNYSVRGKR